MAQSWPHQRYVFLCSVIIALAAGILLAMGRLPWCECGYIKLWHGEAIGAENSQHIADWYSPSHMIHGFLFFAALSLLKGRFSIGLRAGLATLIEAAWEIFENTSFTIGRYRETTMALGYYGDSVVNSVSDIAFMLIGFLVAARLPVWASIVLVLALELVATIAIRDNLTLNIIMLIYPSEAILNWQTGG